MLQLADIGEQGYFINTIDITGSFSFHLLRILSPSSAHCAHLHELSVPLSYRSPPKDF